MDINEIARRAGVSRATVSRYLNDGYVSQEKRQIIARIIKETGYVPSRQARQLRTGKTGLVGVIIPKIYSQSVARMANGITEGLSISDYQIILANSNNDPQKEVQYLHLFADRRRVDGIILTATVITDEHLEALEALDIPIVVLAQRIEGYCSVYHDDYHAVYDMACSILGTCRQPAYIGVREDDMAAGHQRHQAFLDACNEAGLTVLPDAQVVGDFTVEAGYLGCEAILEKVPDVDTIVCATDDIAYGALTCLREYGHLVPDEVQVCGVGDSELSRILMPSLTSAHLFYKTSGLHAAHILLRAMGGEGIPKSHLRIGYEVYARSSTRKSVPLGTLRP